MHVSRPAEFHIICSPDAASIIAAKLALFSRPSYAINVKFYPIPEALIKDRAARAGVASGSRHGAGYAGIVKAFLHEVLYDVKKIIYFDTDMLFLVDPYLLWREFDRYSSRNENFLVAFPTLGEKSTSDVVCSCIMLLNLESMRKKHFMPSTFFPQSLVTLGSPETWASAGIDPQNPQFADQDLYFAIWKRFGREMFENLSVAWDTTHCRFSYGLSLADGNDSMTESEQISHQDSLRGTKMYDEFDQLYPAVLHLRFPTHSSIICSNCQPDALIAWDDPLNSNRPRWGPFVKVAKEYKWVWLNRGDGSVGVRIEHIGERPFWDELTYAS
ncbi:glycosyltransferase family 8 protein [Athelia psychrophila]|uniref:Glycosyltransferase family 8 protein n=1 Tax=Athelia psychrophila TaxID=1759441 RepID=A0A166CJZ2_9AGAM|nr:glycosyltransferase family 8 protein [Fibularhizoctonia sp. CBS 109695]